MANMTRDVAGQTAARVPRGATATASTTGAATATPAGTCGGGAIAGELSSMSSGDVLALPFVGAGEPVFGVTMVA